MTLRPHILVFEPEATGHQMEHLRYLFREIERKIVNARVTLLTTTEANDHPNGRRLVRDFAQLVNVRIAPVITQRSAIFRRLGSFYERQWKNAESLDRGFAEIGPDTIDFVLVSHLEAIGLLQLALRRGLFRGKPWATIAVAVRFHHRKCGIDGPFRWLDVLQKLLFERVVRDPALACFGTVNPYLAQAVKCPKLRHCPEPCEATAAPDADAARAAYGIRPDTCVVLVYGFIDRRKCIDVLLEGVMRVSPSLDMTVLLAGPQHAGHVAAVLDGKAARTLRERGRLVEVNRFIMNGQDPDPTAAADIAWVFYDRNFVVHSSVLVRSSLSRRPVMARRQGIIGRLVEENELGLTLSSGAPDAVAAALTRLARDPALRNTMGESGAHAFALNTPENFARPIVAAINRTVADA